MTDSSVRLCPPLPSTTLPHSTSFHTAATLPEANAPNPAHCTSQVKKFKGDSDDSLMLGSKHVTIPKIKSSNYVGVRHFPKDSILSKESPRMGVPRSPAASCKNSLLVSCCSASARISEAFKAKSDDEHQSLLTPRIHRIHRICTSLGWDTSMLYLALEITGVALEWHGRTAL